MVRKYEIDSKDSLSPSYFD